MQIIEPWLKIYEQGQTQNNTKKLRKRIIFKGI